MMRHELEMLKHSQSTEGNTAPKRPRKKMVKRALSVNIIITMILALHCDVL